jgi:transcriptional regulator GlxA family with amidase domain
MSAPHSLKLGILALEGGMLSSVANPGDTLRVAQALADIREPGAVQFESIVVSARGRDRMRTANGLELVGLQPPPQHLDMLLIPGVIHRSPQELLGQLEHLGPEAELISALHLRGVRIAASCSGTVLLASTGLLDGRRATTSWWLANLFRRSFPKVQLEADSIVVEDGDFYTSGAASSVQQLALRLIEQTAGPELAQQTARMLLIDPERQSQAPYVSDALMERPRSSLSEKAERFLQKELHREITVTSLAKHCGTSERSLLRHFHSQYGASPLAHIQRLRVERAKAMLEATHLSFDEIVERCGYSDVSSFRKLFKRATTLTPIDYRDRFRLRAR